MPRLACSGDETEDTVREGLGTARSRARDRRHARRAVHRPAPRSTKSPRRRPSRSCARRACRCGARTARSRRWITPRRPILTKCSAACRSRSSPRRARCKQLEKNCREFGVELLGLGSDQRGIVHVIGPELGATQPGKTIVCGDSHTATHGAFGALAFGIGTTEVGHVLATQCLLQRRPKTLAIEVSGRLRDGRHRQGPDPRDHRQDRRVRRHRSRHRVSRHGDRSAVDGRAHDRLQHVDRSRRARRHDRAGRDDVRVSQGPPLRAAGRRVGSRRRALADAADRSRARASTVSSTIDASELEPMITYGTHPGMVVPITGSVPDRPSDAVHAKSLAYMGLHGGEPLLGKPIQVVFVGSCTNARLSDLRARRARAAKAARSRAACACWSCRARSRSSAKPKRADSPRSSPMPAPSGASPAARCASA